MVDREKKWLRIIHEPSGNVIAEGPVGLGGLFPFEGNFYIHPRCLKTHGFRPNWIPGLCIYKFLYVWLDFHASDGSVERSLGWFYWLPNPLFFFIAFRTAVPMASPFLSVTPASPSDCGWNGSATGVPISADGDPTLKSILIYKLIQ
ncbi:MAG TPA: hypothetical protein VIJ94_07705 [Caulobacteraceae bacterium]